MEKRAFFILFVGGLMLTAGSVLAQDDASAIDDPYAEEEPPAESGDEAEAAEDAPAEGEKKPVDEEEAEAEEEESAEPAEEEAGGEEAATSAGEATGAAEGAAAESDEEDEEGEEEGDEDKEKPFRRTFAGTSVYWDNEFTAVSLDKGHDYTWNPNYSMGFGFAPVWNVTDSFSLSTNIGFSVELTNSDFSNERNEVFFNDIPINGSYKYKVDINDDVKFGTGLNGGFLLPTSRMSRYVTLYTALTIGTNATFTFPKVLQGLSLGWKPSFTKFFHASENPKTAGNPLDESPIPDTEKASSVHYQTLAYSPGENPSWRLNNNLFISLGIWETLSFTFGYTHGYTYKYSATNRATDETEDDCIVDPMGCDSVRDTGHNERGIYSQSFSYSFGYTLPAPVHMVSLSLGALTATNQLAPDGQYRTPFFNRETVINFGVTIDIDTMVKAITGDDEGEGEGEDDAEE